MSDSFVSVFISPEEFYDHLNWNTTETSRALKEQPPSNKRLLWVMTVHRHCLDSVSLHCLILLVLYGLKLSEVLRSPADDSTIILAFTGRLPPGALSSGRDGPLLRSCWRDSNKSNTESAVRLQLTARHRTLTRAPDVQNVWEEPSVPSVEMCCVIVQNN